VPDDGYNALAAAFTMISARCDGKPRVRVHPSTRNARKCPCIGISEHGPS